MITKAYTDALMQDKKWIIHLITFLFCCIWAVLVFFSSIGTIGLANALGFPLDYVSTMFTIIIVFGFGIYFITSLSAEYALDCQMKLMRNP